MNSEEGNFRKLGVKIDYGEPDEPAIIVMVMEREDGKGVVTQEFIPEQAMNFAYDLGTKTQNNQKAAGIAIEREDDEIEMVTLPPDAAIKLAEAIMKMAMKAKMLNEEKGFILKEEFKDRKPFIYKDMRKGTFK